MNKIVIPAILVATILITGFFAFMPIDEAITVHTTLQTQIGESFRISSGSQSLGTQGGDNTYTLSCSNDCIVESIHGWTTGTTDDEDIVCVRNISGVVNVLRVDLTCTTTDNALGDLSVGDATSNIVDLLKMIQSLAPTGADQSTVESISVPGGSTVVVTISNSVDAATADASFVVIFTGRNLGTTLPTFAFA